MGVQKLLYLAKLLHHRGKFFLRSVPHGVADLIHFIFKLKEPCVGAFEHVSDGHALI